MKILEREPYLHWIASFYICRDKSQGEDLAKNEALLLDINEQLAKMTRREMAETSRAKSTSGFIKY